jgi:tetratricopeptide (TPR) repeat protein
VWNAKKDYDMAVADFSYAIKLDANSAEAFSYRGAAWNALGNNEKALADFNQAIRLKPDFEIAYINRGSYWLSTESYGKALSDFREAFRINPSRLAALNNLAWVLATAPDDSLRNGKEAIELAKRACELTDWEVAEYLDTLAAAYAEIGDFQSAVEWQKKSMDTTSEDSRKEAQTRLELFMSGKPFRSKHTP